MSRSHIYLILLAFFATTNSIAQPAAPNGSVSGKVIDEKTKSALDFATIALFKTNSTTQLKAAQSDLNGNFSFKSLSAGTYQVKVSFVGYSPISKTFTVVKEKNTSLGNIALSKSNVSVLNEVVVTGRKNTISLGIDRKVFNADASLATQGGTATDLLATVPSVQVDLDGNISLRGTNNVRVLIDGKPSTFGGGDVTAILQSLPANAIEKVELITNPSSKYDPEGQSGIINIVLKKNQRLGFNGNVNVSAGRLDNYNFNTGLNYRNEKWNFSGNYSFRTGDRLGFGTNSSQFYSGNALTSSTDAYQNSTRSDKNHTVKLGAEYYFTDKTSLALSGNLNTEDEENNETVVQRFYDANGNLTDNGPGYSSRPESGYGYDLNLDFFHKFKADGEELVSNLSFGNRTEDEFEDVVQNYFDPSGNPSDRLGVNRRNDVAEDNRNVNIQVDYTKPFGDGNKLEIGYRTTLRYNDEDQISDTLLLGTPNYSRDNDLTSLFEMEDIVHAVYTNFQKQFTKNFGAQVGFRAEQAYLNTTYTGMDQDNNPLVTEGKLDYLRVYPSIYLTQKLKGENQLQLSYSRRVNRPRGWQVNPFPDVDDRYNIRIGNPNLRPEDIHSFELAYAKFWPVVTLTSSVYFRQVNDVVQSLREENEDLPGGTISRFYNIARNQSVGLELISRADVTKNFNLTGNLNFFQTYFKGDESLGINDNDGFNWNGSLNGTWNFLNDFAVQANFFYSAPRTMSQGRMNEMSSLDAGVKYTILNKKGSLGLNVQDIFNSRRFGMYTNNGSFVQDFMRRRQGQMWNLSFSYRFGKAELSQKKNRKSDESMGGSEDMDF